MTNQRSNFSIWLEAKLGTRLWVVAPRLTAHLSETYEIAISQARFTALRREYLDGLAA